MDRRVKEHRQLGGPTRAVSFPESSISVTYEVDKIKPAENKYPYTIISAQPPSPGYTNIKIASPQGLRLPPQLPTLYSSNLPASNDKRFYELLDSAAVTTTADEDAIAQNKRIKEAEFAEDSREPTTEEEAAPRAEVEEEKRQEAKWEQERRKR
ncbi:hypothetical protein MMC20_005163 [Loxospora ochrophaea]|nr:hypothetical protein [Loxospora ochrophaea]